MDFLDPRKQRTHRIRLMIGYGLMAIAVGLSTLILVYAAYGYSFNTKTGDIVQNGLLFIDSKPGGANIYLNGSFRRSTTSARLVLPANAYNLTLKKSAYRDWQRSILLNEHTITRYVYPFLFPVELSTLSLKSYPSPPGFVTQSPDQRWLLVQNSAATPPLVSFDQFDTRNPRQAPPPLNLPTSLLTSTDGSKLSLVEWAADNNQLLVKHSYNGGSEFIVINRSEPAKSININRLFKIGPTEVVLRNKKTDQLYIFNQSAATLQVADLAQTVVHPPFLKDVITFKAYGSNLISYVTTSGLPAGQAVVNIWDQGKIYPLLTLATADKYLVDAAQFHGHWYYLAGSNNSQRINIYKDPLNSLRNPIVGKALPIASLHNPGTAHVSFSTNTRFIVTQAGQNFAVYDIEEETSYHYQLSQPLGGPVRWMDGHRLMAVSNGNILIMDYDGINQQILVPTVLADVAFFDRDFNQLFTAAPVTNSPGANLQLVELRAGADLPSQ